MTTQWVRTWITAKPWAVDQMIICHIPSGSTLERCHFGIRWQGVTSTGQDFTILSEDFMAYGVVTQTSAHGATAPNALTALGNAAPPLERWLYWRTTTMQPSAFGQNHDDLWTWSTGETGLIADTHGEVKANVPAGQTLDVYLTWAPWVNTGWAVRGIVRGSAWSSALIST